MLPVKTSHIPFADRILVGLHCSKCCKKSEEPLSGLHGRMAKVCRNCGKRIRLGDEHNGVLIEQLVKRLSRRGVYPYQDP